MARYIFIDHHSGYIWGDSADIDGRSIVTGTPCEVAAVLDYSFDPSKQFEYRETHKSDPTRIYDVYRADVEGSEVVGTIHDGQDQDMIDTVERDCRYVTSIARTDAA